MAVIENYTIETKDTNDCITLLNRYQLSFSEDSVYYNVGAYSTDDHKVFISVIFPRYAKMLEELIPIVASYHLSFRTAKETELVRLVHDGHFGFENIGKSTIIFIPKQIQENKLEKALLSLATRYNGPHVPKARRVSGCLYSNTYLSEQSLPDNKPITAIDRLPVHYKNVSILFDNPKGRTLQGIYVKNDGSEHPCIIKEAGYQMLTDKYQRNMITRLQHQWQIHEQLKGEINIPTMFEFEAIDGVAYLSMEKLPGESLLTAIRHAHRNYDRWGSWDPSARKRILNGLLGYIRQVDLLHQRKFVHWDINPANCWLLPKGEGVYMIDLETIHPLFGNGKQPPYSFGSPGFQSLNQEQQGAPDTTDDVFAIGGSIFFSLTGIHPQTFALNNRENLVERITYLIGNMAVAELIHHCTAPDPSTRPTLTVILGVLERERTALLGGIDYSSAQSNFENIISGLNSLIENALQALPWHLIREPENTVHINLIRNDRNDSQWNGLLNGNLGMVYTIIRAHSSGYEIPISETQLSTFLYSSASWHLMHYDGCDKFLPNGIQGLAFVLMSATKLIKFELDQTVRALILKSLAEPEDETEPEKSLFFKIVLIQHCLNLTNDDEIVKIAQLQLLQTTATVQKILEKLEKPGHKTVSQFGLYKTCFALEDQLTDKNSLKMLEKIKKSIANILTTALNDMRNFGLSYNNEIVYQNITKIMKIIFCSGSQPPDIMLQNQAVHLLKKMPGFLTHNNLNLDSGLSFYGCLYLKLRNILEKGVWHSRADHLAMLIRGFTNKSGKGNLSWVLPRPYNNFASICSGNSGIINFLIDYENAQADLITSFL